LRHLLKAVKTAEIWHQEEEEWKNLVTRNVGRDPAVKPFVESTKQKLAKIGITTVKELRPKLSSLNDLLKESGEEPMSDYMIQLMTECANTQSLNTGHIVFASGPAELKGENEYRIRVVHSTKYGVPDRKGNITEGVQEYFRRFRLEIGPDGVERWTRPMKKSAPTIPIVDETNNDNDTDDDDLDDDDDDDDAATNSSSGEPEAEECPNDDMAGSNSPVDVLAARMCF
jgi:hypothetical protein